jgi:ABC-2 type transport system ATP-binding protein
MSVKVQNLSKHYGSQKAVDQISFEIPNGQVVGFLGPNGAGSPLR